MPDSNQNQSNFVHIIQFEFQFTCQSQSKQFQFQFYFNRDLSGFTSILTLLNAITMSNESH